MRTALYNAGAAKMTVSLTLNADLYAKARKAGLDTSQIAERALAAALADDLAGEVREDLEALNRHVAEQAVLADRLQEHDAVVED
ncbi:type II toxin-antitoxin system CcdA family antitoxin [Benzoatithermus flavus]|uniref:Type II toxin-antitoxin system CcdA family antitoxin n=1 Tax=Benzoatithermus flavus TaxID=3108223 RepID=A0ABU8XUT0_9PROT